MRPGKAGIELDRQDRMMRRAVAFTRRHLLAADREMSAGGIDPTEIYLPYARFWIKLR
jgi:hypothetical protein